MGAGSPGHVAAVLATALGAALLVALALGFGSYAAWRFAQAVLDRDDNGEDLGGWARRGGAAAKGLFYGGLALVAASFVTGPRGESRDEPERTRQVFELPLGRWFVLAAGAAILGYGLWNGFRSLSGRYRKHVDTARCGSRSRAGSRSSASRVTSRGWCCSR